MPPRDEPADQPGDGQQQQKSIAGLLDSLALAPVAQPSRKDIKDKYAFWGSQPVMQFSDEAKVSNDTAEAVQCAATSVRLQPAPCVAEEVAIVWQPLRLSGYLVSTLKALPAPSSKSE